MAVHAQYSPSGADRWMICTASSQLIKLLIERGELRESDMEGERTEQVSEADLIEQNLDAYEDAVLDPTRSSTEFSAEGTVMHDIRANCLALDLEPSNFLGQTWHADGFSFTLNEDMLDRLTEGVDWIRGSTASPVIEARVPLSDWLPDQFGFCDTYWVADRVLYISDYKNGVGQPVAAIGNRQLRLYGLGALAALGYPEIDKVIINIDQPRAGGMKFWEITLAELMAFGEEVMRVYERIQSGDVEYVPTEKGCKWCPIRKTERGCAAYNNWMCSMIGADHWDPASDAPKFRDPSQMPKALRFYIVQHAPAIRQWLAKMHDESLTAAIAGEPDPNSKAVAPSAGRRTFSDENKKAAEAILAATLGDEAYKPRALIGFTEIDVKMKPGRKKVGYPASYAELAKLVTMTPGKPRLVSADHPADAYTQTVEDDFDDQVDDDLDDDFDEQSD